MFGIPMAMCALAYDESMAQMILTDPAVTFSMCRYHYYERNNCDVIQKSVDFGVQLYSKMGTAFVDVIFIPRISDDNV